MNEDLNVMLNVVIFVQKTVSLPNVTYNLPRRFIPLHGKKKCKICFDYIIIIYIIVVFEHDDATVGGGGGGGGGEYCLSLWRWNLYEASSNPGQRILIVYFFTDKNYFFLIITYYFYGFLSQYIS